MSTLKAKFLSSLVRNQFDTLSQSFIWTKRIQERATCMTAANENVWCPGETSCRFTLCVALAPALSKYMTTSMWLFSQASISGVR